MLQFEELKLRLEALQPQIDDLARAIGLDQLRREADELDAQSAAPGFWDDQETAKRITQKAAIIKGKIEHYEKLRADEQDTMTLIELANDFGMEVVPMTNHLGHASQARGGMGKHAVLDQNPRLATLFEPDGWTWCLSNPRVHTLLRRFREELIEAWEKFFCQKFPREALN